MEGGACWTPLRPWPRGVQSKIEGELIESSQSEDDRKMKATEEIEKENAGEEVKKEKHRSSIVRRWWSNAKNKGENLIMDDDVQRRAEATIDNE